VDDHAGALVDDDDGIVFVENVERNVLRCWSFARRCDLVDDDDVARLQSPGSFARGVVDADMSGVD